MNLRIRDPEAYRLAKAISAATGESMTKVVTEALRERLARCERAQERGSVEELLAIADRTAALLKRPYADYAELLYDEHGLPK
ncbi:MAG: type II toxin-antitoxin system VapB family antitoxin [Alphaproteobacteria bacterium]|nr:type II toxin-antitoxin system VapB family antitoxin [Alphaproteobacteria bacterium]